MLRYATSEKTGLWQLPIVSSVFEAVFEFTTTATATATAVAKGVAKDFLHFNP